MEVQPDPRTSATLLARLPDPAAEAQAWAEFVRRYGQLVCSRCRRSG
jgi:hypothetical protein